MSSESTKSRILWIDDEARKWNGLRRYLNKSFDVETAENYEDARERLAERSFDLVIADLLLPGTEGSESLTPYLGLALIRHIRDGEFENRPNGTQRGTPVAVLSQVDIDETSLAKELNELDIRFFRKWGLFNINVAEVLKSMIPGA